MCDVTQLEKAVLRYRKHLAEEFAREWTAKECVTSHTSDEERAQAHMDTMQYCRSHSDGDCFWRKCPQNNPATRQSHCPLDTREEE